MPAIGYGKYLMRKYALLLTARDKVRHVADAVKSMYAQVGPPITIYLSDQGSVDGTNVILDDLKASYRGPHKIIRLNCPVTDIHGMPGLNAHINWAMTQIEEDVVMQLSADDYDLAQRSELTIAAFEAFNPSMVLGAMYTVDEGMKYLGETPQPDDANPDKDMWITVEQMFPKFVGGSTCQAWTREFWDKAGPLEGVASPDVVLPFLAVLDKGAYYLHTKMHAYRKVLSASNTGLEGVYYSYPEGDKRRQQLEELIHFQVSAGLYTVLRKMQAMGIATPEAHTALLQAAMDRSASWVKVREEISLAGIPPIAMKV
jgi:hypothetical protein